VLVIVEHDIKLTAVSGEFRRFIINTRERVLDRSNGTANADLPAELRFQIGCRRYMIGMDMSF